MFLQKRVELLFFVNISISNCNKFGIVISLEFLFYIHARENEVDHDLLIHDHIFVFT